MIIDSSYKKRRNQQKPTKNDALVSSLFLNLGKSCPYILEREFKHHLVRIHNPGPPPAVEISSIP